MPLEFTTSGVRDDIPDVPIVLDGRELTARCPKKIIWSRVIASTTADATEQDMLRAAGLFLDVCFAGEDAMWLERRYRDTDDDLDLDVMSDITAALLEEWEPYMSEEVGEMKKRTAPNRAAKRAITTRKPSSRASRAPVAAEA
jgi:hypothetical protein